MHENTANKTATVCTNVVANNYGSNARRVYTNKIGTVKKGNAKKACANVAVTVNIF